MQLKLTNLNSAGVSRNLKKRKRRRVKNLKLRRKKIRKVN